MRRIGLIALVVFASSIFIGCNKDSDDSGSNEEIEFNIAFSNAISELKNMAVIDSSISLDDAELIVLTIKTSAGEETKYTSEEIGIYKMNDNYFSEKLSLVVGGYQITEFFLLDGNNNTIYAAPIEGSQQAQNVNNPLPIHFAIQNNQITAVNVEVVSTEGLSPDDFGLVGFVFSEVPTFSFLINVSEPGQMDSLLTAELLVENGNYRYSQDIEAIANNLVTIRADYAEYTLSISKYGFQDYSATFTVDSLKQYSDIPLTIELQKAFNGTVTDIDGNIYNTVTIGNQVWMVENLKVTRFNDGSPILTEENNYTWINLSVPAYCWYSNDSVTYGTTYGALYNWHAVNSGKLAPEGWHIPSESEWNTLINYLGGDNIAGGKLKQTGTEYWLNPNYNATDEVGFKALPAGYRATNGSFLKEGEYGMWWSNTEYSSSHALLWRTYHDVSNTTTGEGNKIAGISVRCIKD